MNRAVASAIAALTVGCGAAAEGGKADGPAAPVEVVLLARQNGSGLGAPPPAVDRFVALVEEVSDGALTVRISPALDASIGSEITEVAAGQAVLGWTDTRVIDEMGVRELRPLEAPFLVDSYELQAAILESDLPTSMLPAVRRLGVEPLALLADELRHPAGSELPLLGPEAWASSRFWLLESAVQFEGLATIGAQPFFRGDIRQRLVDGTAEGLEIMWRTYAASGEYLYAPLVVANAVLAPRSAVLFADPAALSSLTAEQHEWIREAASAAQRWAIDHAADAVDDAIATSCRSGARVALASDDDLAALAARLEPVYERLRADAATAAAMAAIEDLKASVRPGPAPRIPPDCRFDRSGLSDASPTPLLGPGATGALPLGTYRYELDETGVVETDDSSGILRAGAGDVFTWELGAGTWRVTVTPNAADVEVRACEGWLAVDGDVVTFTHNPAVHFRQPHCLPPAWTARWALTEEGIRWSGSSRPILGPHFERVAWRAIG